MRAEEILQELSQRGVRLAADGERLCIDAPKGAVGEALFHELRQHKPEVLALLRRDGGLRPAPAAAEPSPARLGLSNFDLGHARTEFARHSTQPAWDDLIGAARLERQQVWCQETLEAVYRGQLTLWLDATGRVIAFPRSMAS